MPAGVKSWAGCTSCIQADPGLPTLDHDGTLLSSPRTQMTPYSDLSPLPSSSPAPSAQLPAQQSDPTRPENPLHVAGGTDIPSTPSSDTNPQRFPYLSIPSPMSSSPSSSSSGSPSVPRSPSDSSSKGGRSRPGLDVKASPRRELRTGLVTAACDSEESCKDRRGVRAGDRGEGGAQCLQGPLRCGPRSERGYMDHR